MKIMSISKEQVLERWFGDAVRGKTLKEISKHCRDMIKPHNLKKSSVWPYEAPPGTLPAGARLPTLEEIEKVRDTENHVSKFHLSGEGTVYRVNDIFAVKFSSRASIIWVSSGPSNTSNIESSF